MTSLSRLKGLPLALMFLLTLSQCTIVAAEGERGLGESGQPCTPWGSFACSQDGTEELECVEGWYVTSADCPGGCVVEGQGDVLLSVRCDSETTDVEP